MDVKSTLEEASSSTALTQHLEEQSVNAVMFQVLDNPSLREEILKHVIFGKDGVDRKAACALRLVDKSWNESVVRILRKAHEHLFKLGHPIGNEVKRFVSTFALSAQLMGSVPPLAIHDFGPLCHPENLKSFSNCLTRCGNALIQLGFQIGENGRPFKAGLPNWSLPYLHKLNILLILDFRDNRSRSDGPDGAAEDGQNDDNLVTCLVKSVLSNATALSELSLRIACNCPVPREGSQFTVFDSVILPPSITKITASITRETHPLDMLARSPLPNLTSLTMDVGSGLFSDGLIIRILENCRKSLKNFELREVASDGNPRTHNVARFPVMEQLVTLSMHGIDIVPELGHDSLDKYFPKLATLHLPTQTIDNFQMWAGSAPLPGVRSLRLNLRQNSKASLNVETMQRINFVLPNLRKLEVTMSSEDSSGLEYIFREMRQLTDLEIKVECYRLLSTSDNWDSLLTGVPKEVIARSRVDPEFWAKHDLEDEVGGASIKNLSELKKCSLTFDRIPEGRVFFRRDGLTVEYPYPSISDFVFNSALLRMPTLRELHLARRSSHNVSQEMTAQWRNDGRSLTFDY